VAQGEAAPVAILTLEIAMERLLHNNPDLLSRFHEIPAAQADTLAASLVIAHRRGVNLGPGPGVPSGQMTVYFSTRPDIAQQHLAHTLMRVPRTTRVIEAQYLDAVRRQIDTLYTAFIDLLAAQERVLLVHESLRREGETLKNIEKMVHSGQLTERAANRVKIQRAMSALGVSELLELLLKCKRSLGVLLRMPTSELEVIEVRGALADLGPAAPPVDELISIAQSARPDLLALRLGTERAEADLKFAERRRLADPTLPIENSDEGANQPSQLDVAQAKQELAALERQVIDDVRKAFLEYTASRFATQEMQRLLPLAESTRAENARADINDEASAIAHLDAERDYRDILITALNAAVRHRRSMLNLNTALGQRILR
jgi:cobalt-zinc-cadmium efflux system outer membrane protein